MSGEATLTGDGRLSCSVSESEEATAFASQNAFSFAASGGDPGGVRGTSASFRQRSAEPSDQPSPHHHWLSHLGVSCQAAPALWLAFLGGPPTPPLRNAASIALAAIMKAQYRTLCHQPLLTEPTSMEHVRTVRTKQSIPIQHLRPSQKQTQIHTYGSIGAPLCAASSMGGSCQPSYHASSSPWRRAARWMEVAQKSSSWQ